MKRGLGRIDLIPEEKVRKDGSNIRREGEKR